MKTPNNKYHFYIHLFSKMTYNATGTCLGYIGKICDRVVYLERAKEHQENRIDTISSGSYFLLTEIERLEKRITHLSAELALLNHIVKNERIGPNDVARWTPYSTPSSTSGQDTAPRPEPTLPSEVHEEDYSLGLLFQDDPQAGAEVLRSSQEAAEALGEPEPCLGSAREILYAGGDKAA